MKYCPHCDMEFIDSVDICTDCGRPLVDKDQYFAEKAVRDAEEKKKKEEMQKKFEAMAAEAEKQAEEAAARPASGVYVKRADRYEDLRSSASAFLIVGIILAVITVLSFGNLLGLPFAIPSNFVMQFVFLVMTVGSFIIWHKTKKNAQDMQGEIAEEQKTTEQLTKWFLDNYTAEAIDDAVRRENGELRPEILALKRMNYIQDVFVTNYDIADQSYIDALAENLYSTLYAEEDAAAAAEFEAAERNAEEPEDEEESEDIEKSEGETEQSEEPASDDEEPAQEEPATEPEEAEAVPEASESVPKDAGPAQEGPATEGAEPAPEASEPASDGASSDPADKT